MHDARIINRYFYIDFYYPCACAQGVKQLFCMSWHENCHLGKSRHLIATR